MTTSYGVIGIGPVGTTIACHLREAGYPILVLCETQKQFDTLNQNPLKVSGSLNTQAHKTNPFLNLKDFLEAKPSMILMCVKSCHSLDILKKIKELEESSSSPNPIIVSFQNGLDVEEQIIDTCGSHRALRMVLNMGCNLTSDTEAHVGWAFTHFLSLRKEVDLTTTKMLAQHLTDGGFKTELKEEYRVETFKKAMLNSAMGTISALTQKTIQDVMEDPNLSRMIAQVIREGIEVAQKMGLPIPSSYVEEGMAYLSKGGNHKPSMLMDVENNRKTENEYHCGKFFHYAQKEGVQVPVIQTLYYLMKNWEDHIRIQKG